MKPNRYAELTYRQQFGSYRTKSVMFHNDETGVSSDLEIARELLKYSDKEELINYSIYRIDDVNIFFEVEQDFWSIRDGRSPGFLLTFGIKGFGECTITIYEDAKTFTKYFNEWSVDTLEEALDLAKEKFEYIQSEMNEEGFHVV